MRISITIPDPMYRVIKEEYERIGFTSLNDFILDSIRRSELYKATPMHQNGATIEPEVQYANTLIVDDPMTEEEDEYGICPFCFVKKPKIVKLVTYKDEDMVRQEGKLCEVCINKSKSSGAFIGYGGIEDNG